MEIFEKLRGILGVIVLLAIAWAISGNRRKIPWRIVSWGLGLQIAAGYEILPALLAVTALAPLLGAFTTSAIRHRASRRSVWNADVARS